MVDTKFVSIIAEVANTHNGSFSRAKTLIRYVALTGANIIKFQVFTADDLLISTHHEYPIIKKLEFALSTWRSLFQTTQNYGLKIFTDIFNQRHIDFLLSIGCQGFKIHSSDISNYSLIEEVGKAEVPVLLSLGGTTPKETWKALDRLCNSGCKDITLIVGFQAFPTDLADTHLRAISWYKHEFGLPVGFADHTDAKSPMALITPLLAVAAGATLIEKHITYNRKSKPDDYESSIEPKEFEFMVQRIRDTSVALGDNNIKQWSTAEVAYAKRMKKYPLANRTLNFGTTFSSQDYKLQRIDIDDEIFPAEIDFITGKKIIKELAESQIILHEHFEQKIAILISARSSSSRLPKKALLNISGKPAIVWLINRLKKSKNVSKIILCTTELPDDDLLVDIARQQEIDVFRGCVDDVMGRFVEAAKQFHIDIIVRVTGDDLFSDPEYIDMAIQHHLSTNAEYTKIVGLPDGIGREVISLYALEWLHTRLWNNELTEYMTWFLNQPNYIRVSSIEAAPLHMRPELRLTLDTVDDLKLFTWILEYFIENNSTDFTLTDIIKLLDSFPDKIITNTYSQNKISRTDVNVSLNLNFSTKKDK